MHRNLEDCYRLLPRVSRTFALNIRILPGALRPTITVAYLLFRYADTLEDAPGLEIGSRSELFEAFLDRLDGRAPLRLPEAAQKELLESIDTDESELILHGERIFAVFESFPASTQGIIASHVSETARGMQRFVENRTESGRLQLQNWEELDEYCYYVAGTIGIMLTRLFAEHSHHIAPRNREHLTALGTSFGRGLQLTNILKGIAVDHGEGRVYLPREVLARHGVNAANLLSQEARPAILEVVREIVPRALQDLEDALRYTILLPRREPRLRLFCLWPLFTAVRTLAVVADGRGLGRPGMQPKVSRNVLYREMALSVAQVFSNGRLRKRFERFRRDLFPRWSRSEVWAG